MSSKTLILSSKDKTNSSKVNNCYNVEVKKTDPVYAIIKISNIHIKLNNTAKKNNYGTHYLTISGNNTYFQREINITAGTDKVDYWELVDNDERLSGYCGGNLTVSLYNSSRNVFDINADWDVTLHLEHI